MIFCIFLFTSNISYPILKIRNPSVRVSVQQKGGEKCQMCRVWSKVWSKVVKIQPSQKYSCQATMGY
jgi:hypothetical protein